MLYRKAGVVHHPAFDAPLDEGGSYGMRWDGKHVLLMLRLEAATRGLTLLGPGTVVTDEVVPLAEIARCITQPDLGLVSVDVVSNGSRVQPVGEVARVYEQVVGPLPAAAQRSVWVVLRVDPLRIAEDVRSRVGGGSSGVVRSAILVARSIAGYLAGLGVLVSVLTAAEINEAVTELTDGIPFDELAETRHYARHRGIRLSSFAVDPAALNSRVLTNIWAMPSRSTTLTLRLEPAPDGTVALTGVVRFHTKAVLPQNPVVGLKPLPGRQYRALLSALPIGEQRYGLNLEPWYSLPDGLDAVRLPVTGCGQLIGANPDGYAVATPLFGPNVRRVDLIGGLYPAHQVVLRAFALGARVLVHTPRPEQWTAMTGLVNSRNLELAPPDQVPTERTATLIAFDNIPAPYQIWGATVLSLRETPADTGQPADLTLHQHPDTPGEITVALPFVPTHALLPEEPQPPTVVHLVATPDELPYLAAVLPAVPDPASEDSNPAPADGDDAEDDASTAAAPDNVESKTAAEAAEPDTDAEPAAAPAESAAESTDEPAADEPAPEAIEAATTPDTEQSENSEPDAAPDAPEADATPKAGGSDAASQGLRDKAGSTAVA